MNAQRIELMGLAEIARETGIPLGTIHTWRIRGRLPQPYTELACGPIYERREVEAWAANLEAKKTQERTT